MGIFITVIVVTLYALAMSMLFLAQYYQPAAPTLNLVNENTQVDEDGWEYLPDGQYINGPKA